MGVDHAFEGLDYISLTIYGDDPTTPSVDGMVFGEGFTMAMHLFNQDTTITHQSGSLVVLQGGATRMAPPCRNTAILQPLTTFLCPPIVTWRLPATTTRAATCRLCLRGGWLRL